MIARRLTVSLRFDVTAKRKAGIRKGNRNMNGRYMRAAEKPAVRDFDRQTENHVREANAAHSAPQKPQSVPEYSQGSADDFSVIDDSEDLPF